MTYEYYCKYCKTYSTINSKTNKYEEEIQCGCGGSAKRNYRPIGVIYNTTGFYSIDNKKEK